MFRKCSCAVKHWFTAIDDALTEQSDILKEYIIPEYVVLHTQSKEYIVDDYKVAKDGTYDIRNLISLWIMSRKKSCST